MSDRLLPVLITPRLPAVGIQFWWRGDGNPRIVRSFYVTEIKENEIWMNWQVNAGYVREKCDLAGVICWTREEWDVAWDTGQCCLYIHPVLKCGLTADQELCPVCHGTRWEQDRDNEYHPCIWCDFTGVRVRVVPIEPTAQRRSPLHPEMPK